MAKKPHKTLQQYRGDIARQARYVDIKPYSHNIISLTLGMIAEHYGQEEANKAIIDFDLEEKGWSLVQENLVKDNGV